MGKYFKGMSLIKDAKYKLAYQEFSHLIQSNNEDYQAYYYRGIVDFYYLKENLFQTKKDFERVIEKIPKYASELYAPLTILSNMANEVEQTIIYGEKALENPKIKHLPSFIIEINFALSRAYYQRGSSTVDYIKALSYLEQCLVMSDDEKVELYLCKCEILLEMELFDEVLDILDTLVIKYEFRSTIFFIRGRALSEKLQEDESLDKYNQRLEEALYCFNVYLKYDEKDDLALFYRANTLRRLGRVSEALSDYQTLIDNDNLNEPPFFRDELIVEMMRTYEINNQLDQAIEVANIHLYKFDSWQIEYMKAMMIIERYPEQLEQLVPLLEHAYQLSKRSVVAMGILDVYRRSGKIDKCYLWLKQLVDENPNEGRWYYYMGDILLKLNQPYDQVIDSYFKAYLYGYIDEMEYYDMILPLSSNPKMWYRHLKYLTSKVDKIWMNALLPVEIGSAHKISVRYLYGLSGLKVNFKLAEKYAIFCQQIYPKDCCMNVNYGRVLELKGNFDEAYHYYHNAKELTEQEQNPICYCAFGYLAHAYLKGIGTKEDLSQAKNLILSAIKAEGKIVDSSVIYLYAYLALKEEDGFDINEAIAYLEYPSSFLRYEITRYQLLLQLYRKLGYKNIKTYQNMLKKAYRFDSILAKKYYLKHKHDEIYYPFLNHY